MLKYLLLLPFHGIGNGEIACVNTYRTSIEWMGQHWSTVGGKSPGGRAVLSSSFDKSAARVPDLHQTLLVPLSTLSFGGERGERGEMGWQELVPPTTQMALHYGMGHAIGLRVSYTVHLSRIFVYGIFCVVVEERLSLLPLLLDMN